MTIIQRPFEEILPESFVAYSKHVALHRAIPDVRDGLKPVHRRIIYSMDEVGMHPDKPYSKSARLVGDCMGKYHPHGDSSIYEAAVRLAQPWATRYPLVDGHGNFGSVDGDGAAAMRYTEMRMTPLAQLLTQDIEKETVPFRPNYDNRLEEPVVLPAPYPQLLVNGGSGIAVGMASNMPPHNLREVIGGVIAQIDNPHITPEELLTYVPGPDFPTGGFIIGTNGIAEAYATGRGKVIMRAKAVVETGRIGKSSILVTELPYGVNKSSLASKIEQLAEEKIEGIQDVRDETDREGIRLVIECKKDVNPQLILKQLYKHTQMQESFGITNLVVNANGVPEIMGLVAINQAFIEHRKQVVTKRTKYELKKAKARAHILEALVVAINHMDEVIRIIRSSKNPTMAKANLITRFEFTEIQAQAILDMKLQHLTNLELDSIRKEYEEILKLIAHLEHILVDKKLLLDIIKKELKEIAEKYGDDRRTKILAEDAMETMDMSAFDEPEKMIDVYVTRQGYMKQSRRITSYTFKDGDDYIAFRVPCSNRETLFMFTSQGKFQTVAAKTVPEGNGKDRGRILSPIPENETLISVVPVGNDEGLKFLFVTRDGQVMRTPVSDFTGARSPEAITLKEGDRLLHVFVTAGDLELFLVTAKGQCIRFTENEISVMGRKSRGVKGMNLDTGDYITDGLFIKGDETQLITVTERGYIKMSSFDEYKAQGRGGKGIAVAKVDIDKTGLIVGAITDNSFIAIQKNGNSTKVDPKSLKIEPRSKMGSAIVPVVMDDYVCHMLTI